MLWQVSIVSPKAQTTREQVIGVMTIDSSQASSFSAVLCSSRGRGRPSSWTPLECYHSALPRSVYQATSHQRPGLSL